MPDVTLKLSNIIYSMAEPLVTIFDTLARLRLLRMFVFNPSLEVSVPEILRRAKLSQRAARTEITQLERAGIIKRKVISEINPATGKRRKMLGYTQNRTCPITPALRTFLFETAPINAKTVLRHMKIAGKVNVLVIAGVFLKADENRLDILIAFEKFNSIKVELAMRNLEAELGVSIRYAAFSAADLTYRIGMHDKLIRDVFDYPHELAMDKMGVRDMMVRA
jgi:predicted transcriptional regulator